jgi:hypothetical protein
MKKTSDEYLHYYFIEAANALTVQKTQYKAYCKTKFKKITKHQDKRILALKVRNLVALAYAFLKKDQLSRANYQQKP